MEEIQGVATLTSSQLEELEFTLTLEAERWMRSTLAQMQLLDLDALHLAAATALANPQYKSEIGSQWEEAFANLDLKIDLRTTIEP